MSSCSAAHSQAPAIIGSRVELQLLTTLKCNLKCSYCSLGVGDVLGSQVEIKYDLAMLEAFIDANLSGKEIYVTFYGGEPTLNKPMIEAVMARFPHLRFQLQTNGTLLDRMKPAVLAKLSNVLVSIDGGEKTTDGYRGAGIYRQVLKNVSAARPLIPGTITARVTWSNPDTTFEELDQIATSDAFDYLYWQFVADAQYDAVSMEKRRAVLVKLVEKFFSSTERLYPVIPIMGIVRNMVMPSRATELYAGQTQCRASTHLINVMPSGDIYPCPDMLYDKTMQSGSVQDNWLKRSPLVTSDDWPCHECEAYSWCRGNCPKNLHRAYTLKDDVYRKEVVEPVCSLIRFMGNLIIANEPQSWVGNLRTNLRNQIIDNAVYEYVEVMA